MSTRSDLRANLIGQYKKLNLPVHYHTVESVCGNILGCPFYLNFRTENGYEERLDLTPHIDLTEWVGSKYYTEINYLSTQAAHLTRHCSMQKTVNGKKIIISKFKNFIDSHANGLLLCPFCHDLLDYGHVKASIYKYNNQLLMKHTLNIIESKIMWNEYFEGLLND